MLSLIVSLTLFLSVNSRLTTFYRQANHPISDALPIKQIETLPLLPTVKLPVAEFFTIKKIIEVRAPEYLDNWFSKYSQEFTVDVNLLKKIAQCESHFGTGANSGPYGGMFQFSSDTWIATRQAMGLDTNPDLRFNGEESIKTAAFKIARGGISAWPVCSK